jgi:hypothetical protein
MAHSLREVPVLGVFFALLTPPAVAQTTEDDESDDIELDDEIDIDESDDEPAQTPAPPPPPPEDETEEGEEPDESELDDFRDPEEEATDLLDEEEVVPVSDDTEADYRAAQSRLARLGPDEEMAGWEQYLARYPNSAYRSRIEARTEELMDQLYATDSRQSEAAVEDALQAEIDLALPLQLENINPRSRLQLAFEWGLPDYLNMVADYEHQIIREVSVHAGIRRRYSGWNLEFGPRWAIVKSTRNQMIVSAFLDVHLNTNPFYPGFRPQLAFGKIFGKLHAQIQAGPDFEIRTFTAADLDGNQTELQTRVTGGLNLYYAASDRVGVFGEAYTNMKIVGQDGAFDTTLYRFNVASFGLKFYPASKATAADKDIEINVGATLPFMQQYWQYHYGSVMAQFNYFL